MRLGTLQSILVAALAIAPLAAWSAPRDDILALTGNLRARIVWDEFPNGADAVCTKDGHILKGFDTNDGVEKTILSGGRYSRPLIGQDGKRIVYSTPKTADCWVVNWDGSGNRKIHGGVASDFWYDQSTGKEWVYIRPTYTSTSGGIIRVDVDNTGTTQTIISHAVGESGDFNFSWFQLSADGTHAADAYPWNSCGALDLTKSPATYQQRDYGCWPSMCPDNSYRMFIFNPGHTGLYIFDAQGQPIGTPSDGDGSGGVTFCYDSRSDLEDCMYWPKWTNNARFLMAGQSSGAIYGGDAGGWGLLGSNVLMGRFNAGFTAVEQWAALAPNSKAAKIAPDAFIFNSSVGAALAPASKARQTLKAPAVSRAGRIITIALDDQTGVCVDIVDISGHVVASLKGGRAVSWDASTHAPGTYFVRTETAGRMVSTALTVAN